MRASRRRPRVPVEHRGAPSGRRGSLEVSGRNEFHDFVLAHRRCAHMLVDLGPDTESGYRLVMTCDCGTEFMRWVGPDDDGLRFVLLAL